MNVQGTYINIFIDFNKEVFRLRTEMRTYHFVFGSECRGWYCCLIEDSPAAVVRKVVRDVSRVVIAWL